MELQPTISTAYSLLCLGIRLILVPWLRALWTTTPACRELESKFTQDCMARLRSQLHLISACHACPTPRGSWCLAHIAIFRVTFRLPYNFFLRPSIIEFQPIMKSWQSLCSLLPKGAVAPKLQSGPQISITIDAPHPSIYICLS